MDYKVNSNYKNYRIYPNGRVWSIRKKRFLFGSVTDIGYMKYFITFDNTNFSRWRGAHQIVYETFIGPIQSGYEIGHIDNNKLNNNVSNLEMITHKKNVQNSYDTLSRKIYSGAEHWNYGKELSNETKALMSAKKIGVNHPKFKGYYVIDGIKYESAYIAAQALNTYPKKIYNWCKNNIKGCFFDPV